MYDEKKKALKRYQYKWNRDVAALKIKKEQQRKINEENRKKDDLRYNSLTDFTIRQFEKRGLEFNDGNINLVLDIALSSKHFSRFINDDRTRIVNAVKRKYNNLNKDENQNNNGKQNSNGKDRE